MKETSSHGEIRFVAVDKSKKVYVWDAYKGIHIDVWILLLGKKEKLSLREYNRKKNIDILPGLAKKKGKKWVMVSSDEIDEFFYRRKDPESTKNLMGYVPEKIDIKVLKKNFQWVNKYIDINSYFDKFKEDVYYREIR